MDFIGLSMKRLHGKRDVRPVPQEALEMDGVGFQDQHLHLKEARQEARMLQLGHKHPDLRTLLESQSRLKK